MLVWTSRMKVKTPRMNRAGRTAATNGATLPGPWARNPKATRPLETALR
jgi:hypothetical protein